jgi:hypothetical protein
MSHENDKLRHKFLSEVDVGDEVWIQYRVERGRRRVKQIEGYVVSQSFFSARISDVMPEKVVDEQQSKVRLGRVLEYEILEKRYR